MDRIIPVVNDNVQLPLWNSTWDVITWFHCLPSVLSSLLIGKFGCRKTLFVGASLQALGFIGSYIITDNKLLLLTLSLITGTGCGVCYTAAMVVISYHFDRYLGLASGIAISAQGFGTVMINIIETTVNFYGLRNFYLLLAGYVLQNFVFGALLRTSVHEQTQSKKVKNVSILTGKNNIVYKSDESVNESKSKSENLTIPSSEAPQNPNGQYRHEIQYDCEEINTKTKDFDQESLDKNSTDKTNGKLDQPSEYPNKEKSTDEIEMKDNFDSQHLQSLEALDIDVNGQPSNTFTKKNHLQKSSIVSDCNEKETCFGKYVAVLKNYRFIILALFVFLFSCAESTFHIMLPSYFMENGSTKAQVAQVFSFVGIVSAFSRFLTGLILNKNILSLTILFSVPSFLLAICSFFVPYFIQIYWGQLIYCLLFATFNFTVYALVNRICIVIVGVKGTAEAIGMLMLAWGLGSLTGSPVTERIILSTGSSDTITTIIGTFYMAASFVVFPATYRR
ncbi:monocarboxylate transporter 13-like isoform X1 [Octopus vulgaris]|uniref:Monocarboxylate transporter 13-like isoform X1 n=2 Tax=Octopus vulgaris TaxID=6645 RepID=A0AA36BE21_OCTVU|nr:monocarboxylate transporter 13-like isoform X1 [Octopus vulgaris]